VAKVRYTRRAEADLDDIAAYTVATWSVAQAARYLARLEAAAEALGDNPMLGRVYALRPRYSRFEEGSHVMFFRRDDAGNVLIVRIMHEAMLPELHLDEPEDE
jgi:toxin ParE1/3/4